MAAAGAVVQRRAGGTTGTAHGARPRRHTTLRRAQRRQEEQAGRAFSHSAPARHHSSGIAILCHCTGLRIVQRDVPAIQLRAAQPSRETALVCDGEARYTGLKQFQPAACSVKYDDVLRVGDSNRLDAGQSVCVPCPFDNVVRGGPAFLNDHAKVAKVYTDGMRGTPTTLRSTGLWGRVVFRHGKIACTRGALKKTEAWIMECVWCALRHVWRVCVQLRADSGDQAPRRLALTAAFGRRTFSVTAPRGACSHVACQQANWRQRSLKLSPRRRR